MAKQFNRSLILRAAWSRAKCIAAMIGEPVLRHIGAAMRNCWALAKGLVPPIETTMVSQPAQQQQACAAPAKAPDATSLECLREILVGRTATLCLPMGDVTYRIVGVRRWKSSDGVQVRDYIDVEDEGMSRDDRKGPVGIHLVRAGTSRGAKHSCPLGEVRYGYGSFCNSGAKHARVEEMIEALFDVKLPAPAPAMVLQPVQLQQARARNDATWRVRINALGHLGFPCDPDHFKASLWIVTDGQVQRDCATYQEALDLAEESRGIGYIPAVIPRVPPKASAKPA